MGYTSNYAKQLLKSDGGGKPRTAPTQKKKVKVTSPTMVDKSSFTRKDARNWKKEHGNQGASIRDLKKSGVKVKF